MKQNTKNESGRTILEVLAVVGIVAMLTVGGLAGYSYLVQKFKRDESVDQVNQLVVNLKTSNATQKEEKGARVDARKVVAGPKISDQGNVMLPDGNESSAVVYALAGSGFRVDVKVEPDTCEAMLKSFEEGHPDAKVYPDGELGASDTQLAPVRNLTDDERTAFLENCQAGRAVSFVFQCPGGSSSYQYYYDNECHLCPRNEEMDITGICCKFTPGVSCGGRCAGCESGKHCTNKTDPKDTSALCVECLEDSDCPNTWAKHVCVGNVCVECANNGHCPARDGRGIWNEHNGVRTPTYNACFGGRCGCQTNDDCAAVVDSSGNPLPICDQGSHTCVSCPNGLPYVNGKCACPSGTILYNGTCVKCYDSAKAPTVDAGCENEAGKPVCDESQKTVIAGDSYQGVCVECLIDNDCPNKEGKGDKWCQNHQCYYCDAGKYHNATDHKCYACIDDHPSTADQDTGCPLPAGSDHNLCKGTAAGSPYKYGSSCFKCMNNKPEAQQDLGCGKGNPICDAADQEYGNSCHTCKGTATGEGEDLGCSAAKKTPICVNSDLVAVASNVYGTSCKRCINDKTGTGVDTGCTEEEPLCNGAQGKAGTDCSDCPEGQVRCGNGCAKCCDDHAALAQDSGCDASVKTMCYGNAQGVNYRTGGSNTGGTSCRECATNNDCVSKYDDKKPVCNANSGYVCEACPSTKPHWLQFGDRYKCAYCQDDKAGNAKDTGCSVNRPLCSVEPFVKGGEFATGRTMKEGTKCYECLIDSHCPADKPNCIDGTCKKCDGCVLPDGTCVRDGEYIDIKKGANGQCECYSELVSAHVNDDENSCSPKKWDTRDERLTSDRRRYYRTPATPAAFYCTYKFVADGKADDFVVRSLSDGIYSGGTDGTRNSWKEAHNNDIDHPVADHLVNGKNQQKQVVTEDRWLEDTGYKGYFRFKITNAHGLKHSGQKTGLAVSKGWQNGNPGRDNCFAISRWRKKK